MNKILIKILIINLVPPESSVSVESSIDSGLSQKKLPSRIDDHQFDQLYLTSSPANRARLLSVSSCHASSWLAVIPSKGLNLSLEPEEFQAALKWWLGMDRYIALTALTTSWILWGIML